MPSSCSSAVCWPTETRLLAVMAPLAATAGRPMPAGRGEASRHTVGASSAEVLRLWLGTAHLPGKAKSPQQYSPGTGDAGQGNSPSPARMPTQGQAAAGRHFSRCSRRSDAREPLSRPDPPHASIMPLTAAPPGISSPGP